MALTLNELLDATGIGDMSGAQLSKRAAAAKPDLSKLAERCRRAADASPGERADVAAQQLIEKTAQVEVIRRTLAEIRSIEDASPEAEKTASARPDHAAFIKTALEQGHSPDAIARFLDQLEAART